MRAGDQTPININLADGQVLRFSCTALPDGGRMLSYTPVTDLVRHTDDPASIDYYRSLRGGGNRGLIRYLRAANARTPLRAGRNTPRLMRAISRVTRRRRLWINPAVMAA